MIVSSLLHLKIGFASQGLLIRRQPTKNALPNYPVKAFFSSEEEKTFTSVLAKVLLTTFVANKAGAVVQPELTTLL
ncbi:hypothetical protein [Paenibacillus sp. HGF7]|uniref:hypothetical protein n=1 Tax=Paenibacillus sp. HGF7 TaxID=944559 RepID=UPI00056AFA89|nr:hypothetical protein [Paenibacillus sp. HGF7]